MRRSHADDNDARRRQAAAARRFRGHRIRGGLDELGDLDAPQPRRQRRDTTSTATTASAAAAEAPQPTQLSSTPDPHSSAATDVFSTVFGEDWSEWAEVKRVLFDMAATSAAKRAALAVIGVWRLRARKERVLPSYVEATEALVDAMLRDEASELEGDALRLYYGAAISRVVHIITGSFASGAADTYRKRASELGFPEEAVEVRQRVAHGALPLTSELRWVGGLVLQFLFTEYWLEQERQVYLMRHERPTAAAAPAAAPAPATAAEQRSAASRASAAPAVSIDYIKALLQDLASGDDSVDVEVTREEASVAAAPPLSSTDSSTAAAHHNDVSGTAARAVAGWCVS
ncbi:Las1-like [Novymonas esmeraldas]|uniref:Las1-like n=1 Tax=Novymonas esmeraldas TaxID=1808958 RepID=A0AAW0EWZ0_9TRYP